jgi:hypothetical protein
MISSYQVHGNTIILPSRVTIHFSTFRKKGVALPLAEIASKVDDLSFLPLTQPLRRVVKEYFGSLKEMQVTIERPPTHSVLVAQIHTSNTKVFCTKTVENAVTTPEVDKDGLSMTTLFRANAFVLRLETVHDHHTVVIHGLVVIKENVGAPSSRKASPPSQETHPPSSPSQVAHLPPTSLFNAGAQLSFEMLSGLQRLASQSRKAPNSPSNNSTQS